MIIVSAQVSERRCVVQVYCHLDIFKHIVKISFRFVHTSNIDHCLAIASLYSLQIVFHHFFMIIHILIIDAQVVHGTTVSIPGRYQKVMFGIYIITLVYIKVTKVMSGTWMIILDGQNVVVY